MRITITIVLGLVLLCGCNATSTEQSRSGIYLGASLVGAYQDIDEPENVDLADYSAGVGVRGGFRFADQWALELAYQRPMDWSSKDLKVHDLALQGKFYFTTGNFQPYVMGGIGAMQVEVDPTDREYNGGFGRLGGGLEWYLLDFLPIFGELQYTKGSGGTSDFNYGDWQVGLLFRF